MQKDKEIKYKLNKYNNASARWPFLFLLPVVNNSGTRASPMRSLLFSAESEGTVRGSALLVGGCTSLP